MVQYDSKVIQEFANRLYLEAESCLWGWSLSLGFLGFGGASWLMRSHPNFFGVIASTVIFASIGYAVGREQAFKLKLQAQVALCQAKIEENTRKN